MPDAKEGNDLGRVDRYVSILDSASMAEPSTTSRTAYANRALPRRRSWATSVTTAPPREWPIRTMSGSAGHFESVFTALTTKDTSSASVVRLRS